MGKEKRIRAVLFDMDGVLVCSENYINQAGVEMFREKGYTVNSQDFLEFTGMGENKYLGGVAEKHGIPFDLEKDKARTYELYHTLVKGRLSPLPGAIEFIRECKAKGLLTALATSADKIKMEINLREIGLPLDTFNATVNGLEIENKKPAPDIFLKASMRLGVDPQSCLVVEDAVSGVSAGKAAGSKVLALTTTFSSTELKEADWIAKDLSAVPGAALDW